jgi:hypothetical protein
MPFYLYEICHSLDDGNDSRVYEAGFWSPTLAAADEHLHSSMAEAATKQADHIESETGSYDVDILDDGAHGFWITWALEGEEGDHRERLRVAAPLPYETPEEVASARTPAHTPWPIGAVE